ALFLWSSTKSIGGSAPPILGAVIGLLCAVLAGWLFYRGALRLNISRFFRWSGAALIVIAAGVLAYGIHDLQEANILPGLNSLAFDVSATIAPSSWYAVLLKGTIGFTPVTTWLQLIIGWALYLPIALLAYFWPAPPRLVAVPSLPKQVSA
ncbi:MAG: FTR1 family iron permease, partial [Angustibacter sp.]